MTIKTILGAIVVMALFFGAQIGCDIAEQLNTTFHPESENNKWEKNQG